MYFAAELTGPWDNMKDSEKVHTFMGGLRRAFSRVPVKVQYKLSSISSGTVPMLLSPAIECVSQVRRRLVVVAWYTMNKRSTASETESETGGKVETAEWRVRWCVMVSTVMCMGSGQSGIVVKGVKGAGEG